MTLGPQFKYFRGQDDYVTPRSVHIGPIYGTSDTGEYERTIVETGKEVEGTRAYSYRPNSPDKTSAMLEVSTKVQPSITIYPHNYQYTDNWANRYAFQDPQIPLFLHTPSEIRNEVTFLAGTKGARVPSMTMLGIADTDVRRDTGVGLTPSDDLSQHSLKLTKKMIRRGATQASSSMPTDPTNHIPFWNTEEPSSHLAFIGSYAHGLSEGVPEEEVTAGKQKVRQIARNKKEKKKGTPEYTQLTLFDM